MINQGVLVSDWEEILVAGRLLLESGDTLAVENLWIKLWASPWETCGEKFGILWKSQFYTILVGKVRVLHLWVEKFSHRFYTRINRGGKGVLHSFHSPYYYYY